MDLSLNTWINITGLIVLPIVGFVAMLVLRGLRSRLSEMTGTHQKFEAELARLREENTKWRLEIAKEFALKQELNSALQQVNESIHRVDEKLDRLLMFGLNPRP